jgi:hypothetical protein
VTRMYVALWSVASLGEIPTPPEAPTVPWGLNPVAVGAIASSLSALITASGLVIAAETYRTNSRAAARSHAALVSAYRTRSREIRIIDDVECRLIEIQITNSSDSAIVDLSLLLQGNRKNVRHYDPHLSWVSHAVRGNWCRWTLGDEAAVVPSGISVLRFFIRTEHYADLSPNLGSHVAVGFLDRNGRAWTRRLDGELIEGWKMPRWVPNRSDS